MTDFNGEPITVGFVREGIEETQDDGSERLICRAMNWRSERESRPFRRTTWRSGSSTGWRSPACTGRWST